MGKDAGGAVIPVAEDGLLVGERRPLALFGRGGGMITGGGLVYDILLAVSKRNKRSKKDAPTSMGSKVVRSWSGVVKRAQPDWADGLIDLRGGPEDAERRSGSKDGGSELARGALSDQGNGRVNAACSPHGQGATPSAKKSLTGSSRRSQF